MWLLTNAWQRALRQELDPLGLTHAQYAVLGSIVHLCARGTPATQAEVCRFGSIDPNVVSGSVRSLVDLGMVSRTPHEKDLRAYSIRPTNEGLRRYEAARRVVLPIVDRFYAPLGKELDDFARMLRRLNEARQDDADPEVA